VNGGSIAELAWRRAAALAAIAALATALGGCMTSTRPLFPAASAVQPPGVGGAYLALRRAGTRYVRDETVELRRQGRGYDYVNEKGAATPFTLHRLGRGLYAIQATADGGGYVYARLALRGAAGFVEVADCGRQDRRMLAALGVVARRSAFAGLFGPRAAPARDCDLDGARDASKVFTTLDFGAPTGKLVRQ
jgi:hypothetical protein